MAMPAGTFFFVTWGVLGAAALVAIVKSMNKPVEATPNEAMARGRQLVNALEAADLPMARALLQASPDLKARGGVGQTALHVAVLLDEMDIVRSLLKLGADPNVPNHGNQYPLNLTENPAMQALLTKSGASQEVADEAARSNELEAQENFS